MEFDKLKKDYEDLREDFFEAQRIIGELTDQIKKYEHEREPDGSLSAFLTDRLMEANYLIRNLEWVSASPFAWCPTCRRDAQSGHDPSCKIVEYMHRVRMGK